MVSASQWPVGFAALFFVFSCWPDAGIQVALRCRVHLRPPSVEVKFYNLKASSTIEVGERAVPNLINAAVGDVVGLLTRLKLLQPSKQRFEVLKDISGVLRPVWLPPPGMVLLVNAEQGLIAAATLKPS